METSLRSLTRQTDLSQFSSLIRSVRPDISESVLISLEKIIDSSDCKNIRFEKMSSRAAGISKTDECVISTNVLTLPIEYLVYIILHEVSHQHQYHKYGKDYVLDVYDGTLSLDEATLKLLRVEQIADRLAIWRMRGMGLNRVKPRYLGLTDTNQIKNHLSKIRKDVMMMGLTSIEEINDHIHRSINRET